MAQVWRGYVLPPPPRENSQRTWRGRGLGARRTIEFKEVGADWVRTEPFLLGVDSHDSHDLNLHLPGSVPWMDVQGVSLLLTAVALVIFEQKCAVVPIRIWVNPWLLFMCLRNSCATPSCKPLVSLLGGY
eukprot:gene6139-biopygen8871